MQAIAVLEEAIISTSSAQLLLLLGKIQMKACYWKDAVNSFNRYLTAVVSALHMHKACISLETCWYFHAHFRFSWVSQWFL